MLDDKNTKSISPAMTRAQAQRVEIIQRNSLVRRIDALPHPDHGACIVVVTTRKELPVAPDGRILDRKVLETT